MNKIRSYVGKFNSDQGGSIAVLFAVSIMGLLLVAGLAIDSARFHDVSGRMQAALDAAVLSGAKLLADENSTVDDIENMTQAHFSAAITTIGVKPGDIRPLAINVDRSASEVSANATAKMPSFFSRLANIAPMTTIKQTSKVVYSMQPIELSMVLDITGSMNNNNKIADMKIAAKDVIDTLYATALSDSAVRIAVVPYSASVNAGALASAVSTAPPSVIVCDEKGKKCHDAAGVDVDTCVIERQGINAATDVGPFGADKLPNVPTTPYGKYVCPPSTVIPLTGKSDVATIKGTVDSYLAAGATAGHLGTAWGWYMLSPDWAGVLPADSAPKPYSDKSVLKAMIIMTDGLFNTSYISGSSTSDAQQSTESYQQFDALCDGIKAKDITIYTVGFDLSDPTALGELQKCASGAPNFFDAKTGADLKKAFKDIAEKLTTMRVAG
jgi:Flp pilus assembly protein TadG